MRRLAARTALLGALVTCLSLVVGCGDDDDGAASPLDNALGYLAEDAPLAVAIETNLDSEQYQRVGEIVDKFPFGDAAREALKDLLEEEGGSLDQVLPLLGNEFVVGTSNPAGLLDDSDAADDDFVGAIQAQSADELQDAVKREKARGLGEKNGAALYVDDDGDPFAIKDDVLVVAGSRRQLEAAVAQREARDRLTEKRFDEATNGLPQDALVRLYGDVRRLLAADPSTRDARKVKWVNALRTLGATVAFEEDVAKVDFRLATNPDGIAEADLPFAAGSDAPAVIERAGEVAAAIKDPTHIIDFAGRAGQAIDPAGFGDYEAGKRAIEERFDLDFENDLLNQLRGDLGISVAPNGKFGVRAQVRDPRAFDRTLAKLGAVLPNVARAIVGRPVGYARPKRGGDFYALATADGDSIVYGVVDGVFVLANDPRTAGQLSKAATERVPGATGTIVVNADAEQFARQLLRELEGLGGELAGALATGPLGDLTGSMAAKRDGVTGSFRLTFD